MSIISSSILTAEQAGYEKGKAFTPESINANFLRSLVQIHGYVEGSDECVQFVNGIMRGANANLKLNTIKNT